MPGMHLPGIPAALSLPSGLPRTDAVPHLLQVMGKGERGRRGVRHEVLAAHDVVEDVEVELHASSTSASVEFRAGLALHIESRCWIFLAGSPEVQERGVVEPSKVPSCPAHAPHYPCQIHGGRWCFLNFAHHAQKPLFETSL